MTSSNLNRRDLDLLANLVADYIKAIYGEDCKSEDDTEHYMYLVELSKRLENTELGILIAD